MQALFEQKENEERSKPGLFELHAYLSSYIGSPFCAFHFHELEANCFNYSCSPPTFMMFMILTYVVKAQLMLHSEVLSHGPTHWGWCKSSGHFKPKKKKAVVTLLKSYGSSFASSHQCSTLIIDCRSSPSFLWRLIFTPSSAKRIIVRTFFINQRSINNSSILSSHQPSFILYQLLADIWGVSYPKLCTLLTWFN